MAGVGTGVDSFRYEVGQSGDDQHGNKVTTIKCHGRLVVENADQIKEAVKPLIPLGGRIVVDLSDVNYVDSSGLGMLLALKVSAVKQGLCILQFVNMTPRVLELLRLTGVARMLSS
jgi:anti-sigma B factor antagonist